VRVAAVPLFTLVGIVLIFSGCHRGGKTSPRIRANSREATSTYQGRGLLREVSADGRKAVIEHDAITGYMEAMTMEFDVADAESMEALQTGDVIAFRVCVTDTRSWVDQVRKIGHAKTKADLDAPADSIQIGAMLPDCTLVDTNGKTFHLSDFKGSVLAFTFIFTRCPLPDFCPMMNRNFAAVQRELSADNTNNNWQLLSITFDPEYDTPARLSDYARSYGGENRHWKFATGRTDDIRKLVSLFDLSVVRNGGQIEHTLRTVVVDAADRVRKVFVGNEWKTAELIDEMRSAMAAQP